MKIFLIATVIILLVWTLWSIYVSRAEEMTYTVLEKHDTYEIRQYDSYIAATVQVNKGGREGLNQGFRILAGYIFGGNTSNQSIAMTTPVTTQESTSESIAMTTPVLAQEKSDTTTMTFSMPKKYTLATLPNPLNSSIEFREVPEKKFAAYRYGWYSTEKRTRGKKAEFTKLLAKENVKTIGEPIYAGYNGPGTIPFLLKNEILVELP